MSFFSKIFGKTKSPKKSFHDFNSVETSAVDYFSRLSVDNRIITIMKLGDEKQVTMNHFEIFKFAILSDSDIDVKFAALKRIHLLKEHPDLMPMIDKIRQENNYKNLEPYFSMALSRLGLISVSDLEKIVNGS